MTMHFRTLDDFSRLLGNPAEQRIDDDQETTSMSNIYSETGKSAAEVVVMRARKLCFERNQDPSKFEHIHAATLEVLNADKALGERYKKLEGDAE